MENIKPYPFCGSNNLGEVWSGCGKAVECLNCQSCGPVKKTMEQAIDAWNKRSQHDKRRKDCSYPQIQKDLYKVLDFGTI